MPGRDEGLMAKFNVSRKDGRDAPGGDRADARYFTLDYVHDPMARIALKAYAEAARANGYVAFADDLDEELRIES